MGHLTAPLKPRSSSQIFALLLCILALLVTQTFGSPAAYICLCTGKPVSIQNSHCHGPHGKNCHAEESGENSSHKEQGKTDRQDHQTVSREVPARPLDFSTQVITPQILVAVLPLIEVLFPARELMAAPSHRSDSEQSAPFAVTVARTVVLLI